MTYHSPITRDFRTKLDKLRRFTALVENTLAAQVEALDAEVSAKAEAVPEPQRGEFVEYFAEDYFELSGELPSILRYSVLTAADTALEVYLNATCETYAEVEDVRVRIRDLRGSGIDRAQRYLKTVVGMPFPDQSPVWATVHRLHELRNAIVHADGVVKSGQLRKWADSVSCLRIDKHGGITLGREFGGMALTAYESFAEEFDSACEELRLWLSEFPPITDG